MSGEGVHVVGLASLIRELESSGIALDDLKDAFAEIAKEGAQIASSLSPRRSGALAATIRGNRAKGSATITAGRAKVKYAGVINYGWPARNIKASHFMQRADEQMRPHAAEDLEKAIIRLLAQKGLS